MDGWMDGWMHGWMDGWIDSSALTATTSGAWLNWVELSGPNTGCSWAQVCECPPVQRGHHVGGNFAEVWLGQANKMKRFRCTFDTPSPRWVQDSAGICQPRPWSTIQPNVNSMEKMPTNERDNQRLKRWRQQVVISRVQGVNNEALPKSRLCKRDTLVCSATHQFQWSKIANCRQDRRSKC